MGADHNTPLPCYSLQHTALTFAGLNFRGFHRLAIFAFLFLQMQGLGL